MPAAREATAMEMVPDMATGIATGTVTGMVMDVVTETAMAMVMDVATEVAMEMVMEMAMCLVVEVVEVAEAPQPVVGVEEEEEEEEEVVGAEAALEEVAVAEVVVDMIFASTSRIVPVQMRRLSIINSLEMSLQLVLNTQILVQYCIPSTLNFVLDLIIVALMSSMQLNSFDIDNIRQRQDSTERDRSAAALTLHLPVMEVMQLVRTEEQYEQESKHQHLKLGQG